ncbi:hypothetical protein EWM64_g5365 [Hericium alpestre]|uniref:Uncharacterized protein n=1 Tax=Hericium alpestre TaxID=135208 RepID=A0A4Y9ZX61_9AGAM|nr:hypothetical protein EWM64_g5365 [Hericium alpestre]
MPRPSPSEEPAGPSIVPTRKRTKSPIVTGRSRVKRRRITPEVEDDVKPNITDEEDNPRIKLLQDNLKKIQDELSLLTAKPGSTRVKAERAPSPICVGNAVGEVIDLTED